MIEVCAFFKEYTEIQITTEYTLLLNAMSVNLHFAVGKGHSEFYRVQSAHKYDLCVCLFLLCAEVKADCGDIIKNACVISKQNIQTFQIGVKIIF